MRLVQYYFLMTAISFPYGSTGLPVIFRSVDLWTQQRVMEGNTLEVGVFVPKPAVERFRNSPDVWM